MKSLTRFILCVSVLALFCSQCDGQVIAQWNFNGTSTTTVPGGTAAPTPSTGTGTANLFGGTTATFASGNASGGSSDPVTDATDFAWNTTAYPAQSTGDKTRGVQFNVSTVGFSNIQVSYDLRHSNTSSRFEQFQYTLDGTTFNDLNTFDGNVGDTWFNNRIIDLSSIPGANENASFGFRIVSTFEPGGTGYLASGSASTYGPTGTWRFDMVTVQVVPVPEPTTILGFSIISAFSVSAFRKYRIKNQESLRNSS